MLGSNGLGLIFCHNSFTHLNLLKVVTLQMGETVGTCAFPGKAPSLWGGQEGPTIHSTKCAKLNGSSGGHFYTENGGHFCKGNKMVVYSTPADWLASDESCRGLGKLQGTLGSHQNSL